MIRRRFCRAGFDVPVIGLGTYHVLDVKGREIEHERHEVVNAAQQSGADLYDSSPMYGEAERVLADAVRSFRDDTIIATKVWTRHPSLGMEQQIERALGYYGTIDIYQIHNLHDWEEILLRLEQMKAASQIRAIGITHYQESAFPLMKEIMQTGRIDCIQLPYNVARHKEQQEMLDLAAKLDLGVIIMVPLGAGSIVRMNVPKEALTPFKECGCETWAQVLLKYVISDERVHVAIPATTSPERMHQNAAAGEGPLFTPELRREAEAIYKRYLT